VESNFGIQTGDEREDHVTDTKRIGKQNLANDLEG
jgi:hypothetical protein